MVLGDWPFFNLLIVTTDLVISWLARARNWLFAFDIAVLDASSSANLISPEKYAFLSFLLFQR